MKEEEEDKVARNWSNPMDDEIERMEVRPASAMILRLIHSFLLSLSSQNELATMKAKRAQGGSIGSQPPVKRVKQEHMSAFGPGEVIDIRDLLSGPRVKLESKVLFFGEIIDLT